ncbi:hypothetical protein C1N71_12345 [Agrococcus sp. SGAir0287]|nr:hypothetical protein C1N71_12345 [Agrococcus sp. SGAir0287]
MASGIALIAATYGLVRLAYGLLLPDVQHELGIDAPAAGAISASASAVYCLGAVIGFVLARRRARALVVAAASAPRSVRSGWRRRATQVRSRSRRSPPPLAPVSPRRRSSRCCASIAPRRRGRGCSRS